MREIKTNKMAAKAGRICKLCGQFTILQTLKTSSKSFSFFTFQINNPKISCLSFKSHYFGTFLRQFHTDDLDKNLSSSSSSRLQEGLLFLSLFLASCINKLFIVICIISGSFK